MVKLNRRKLLLTGLAAGTGSAIATQRTLAQTPAIPGRPPKSNSNAAPPPDLFDFQGTSDVQTAVANSPVPPPVPYDRTWSKL